MVLCGDFAQLPPPTPGERIVAEALVMFTKGQTAAFKKPAFSRAATLFAPFKRFDLKTQVRAAEDKVHCRFIEQMSDTRKLYPLTTAMLATLKPLTQNDLRDINWRTATMVVGSNSERITMLNLRTPRLAADLNTIVLRWWNPIRLPGSKTWIRDNALLQQLSIKCPEIAGFFIKGAEGMMRTNYDPANGLANCFSCTFESLTWNDNYELDIPANTVPGTEVFVPPPAFLNVLMQPKSPGEERKLVPLERETYDVKFIGGIPTLQSNGSKKKKDAVSIKYNPAQLKLVMTFHMLQGVTILGFLILLLYDRRKVMKLLDISLPALYVGLSRVKTGGNLRYLAGGNLNHLLKLKFPEWYRDWYNNYDANGFWSPARLQQNAKQQLLKGVKALTNIQDLRTLTNTKLQDLCFKNNLPTSGKKQELIDRLIPTWNKNKKDKDNTEEPENDNTKDNNNIESALQTSLALLRQVGGQVPTSDALRNAVLQDRRARHQMHITTDRTPAGAQDLLILLKERCPNIFHTVQFVTAAKRTCLHCNEAQPERCMPHDCLRLLVPELPPESTITLDQQITAYFSPQQRPADAWRCPTCNQLPPFSTHTASLIETRILPPGTHYTFVSPFTRTQETRITPNFPDVFEIHLLRARRDERIPNTTHLKFPVDGWLPAQFSNSTYDLFSGVVHNPKGLGHFTAFGRTAATNHSQWQWYNHDSGVLSNNVTLLETARLQPTRGHQYESTQVTVLFYRSRRASAVNTGPLPPPSSNVFQGPRREYDYHDHNCYFNAPLTAIEYAYFPTASNNSANTAAL